jgi:Tfp pilus assembly protein PilF
MRKKEWIAGIFMISILFACLFAGCATTRSDMAYSNRGFEELCKQNFTKAEEYLEKALEINPDNAYALLNMGCVCQNTGRPEKARQMYQKVIDLESQSPAERSNEDWARGKKLSEIAKRNLETLK